MVRRTGSLLVQHNQRTSPQQKRPQHSMEPSKYQRDNVDPAPSPQPPRWALLWSCVHDTLSMGRRSRRRNNLIHIQTKAQDASRSEEGTNSVTLYQSYRDLPGEEASLSGVSTNSSSFPLKHVLMVVKLPPQVEPATVDYGNAAFLSLEDGQYYETLPLRKKWVSDNGSVSSVSTMTMDPALSLSRNSRYPHYRNGDQQHTMFTMDAILCDESKTNCCSSVTMITEEKDDEVETDAETKDWKPSLTSIPDAYATEDDVPEVAPFPLIEI